MPSISPAELVSALALVGIVILVAALLSGLVERSGVPQVAIFLGLGAALGPAGVAALDIGLDAPSLRIAATLSLALILFTDALSLDLREAREHRTLALLALGPGTLLSAALFGTAAWAWLDLPPPAAAILGAALASTDPVLLKGLLRRPELPAAARHALRLESGLNDVVLLPIVLVALVVQSRGIPEGQTWAQLGLELFLLGPGAGILVGLLALATLDLVRRRIGVRRDYESLYSLGVAFAAYAAAESVHGSGYLAAFAAGLTIASFDVELCDCFQEYGETTAELALLLTFVLLGSSLIWSGLGAATGSTLLFVAFVLLARPAIYLAAFAPARVPRATRWWVAWFGPRGLSTLLLALLAVFAGLPEGPEVFRIACLVVLVSILLHGGTLIWIGRRSSGAIARDAAPPISAIPIPAQLPAAAPTDAELITVGEVQTLLAVGAPVRAIDVRREDAWLDSDEHARGAVRISPRRTTTHDARAAGLPVDDWLVLYCTCPNEETSLRAVRELQRGGWHRARALVGGFDAWKEAGLGVEAKPSA
jgi:NhaP-type Na+/H+ or K+/H+ antiporter/rhodanese-related sulfurtransferase